MAGFSWKALFGLVGVNYQDPENMHLWAGYNSEHKIQSRDTTSRWLTLSNGDQVYWYDDVYVDALDGYKYYRHKGTDEKLEIPKEFNNPSSNVEADLQKIYEYFNAQQSLIPFVPMTEAQQLLQDKRFAERSKAATATVKTGGILNSIFSSGGGSSSPSVGAGTVSADPKKTILILGVLAVVGTGIYYAMK